MLAIVTGKTEYELCSALKTWWFRSFSPPKIFLVDQEGGIAGYDAGMYSERDNVDRKTKPTDLHASMVERHNALVRICLHTIEGQTILELLPITDEDIVSDACYAKNNMIEIGEHILSLPCSALDPPCCQTSNHPHYH